VCLPAKTDVVATVTRHQPPGHAFVLVLSFNVFLCFVAILWCHVSVNVRCLNIFVFIVLPSDI